MSSTAKSFLIKDILSEASPSSSSDDEESKEMFMSKPIDLRRYFQHPLCPLAMRPSTFLRSKGNPSGRSRETHNSPLNALFEMTKKTFDQSDSSKRLVFLRLLTSAPNWLSNCLLKGQVSDISYSRESIEVHLLLDFDPHACVLSLVIRRNERIELPVKHALHRQSLSTNYNCLD